MSLTGFCTALGRPKAKSRLGKKAVKEVLRKKKFNCRQKSRSDQGDATGYALRAVKADQKRKEANISV